ncbi:MAG: helix-hairpin-helix domain-containing protein [Desulfobulbaceae bacterium]|nr:helix-hairpin-helix domain-containing protein [Desulfobulbaceae bacterium]HIJ80016.1 helix-hairpin-helix domain-containing protein [Deltaproteobacteria bacterium]
MKFFLTTIFLLILSTAIAMASTLNINTASTAELETLSGIGATKAQTIVAYRDQHGPFKTVNDLTQVKGIGAKTVERLRKDISVKDE